MNKVLKLSKFLMSVGLKKESYEVYKIAQALPPGYKIDQEVAGEIGGTPAYLTEPLLKKNLELKDIFAKHYDPNFFNNFTYIHYFRGTDGGASDYVKDYGKNSGGNPMELSVVGAYNVSPCSLKSSTESSIGSIDSFAFVVDGTPTSAFYFDTVSSYYGQMNRPAWLETLRNFGIDPDEYNPKISNLHSGNIDTFFYNQDSYKMVAESVNRKSDYHEIILKNAKVKQIIVDKRMNKDEVKDFFEKIDPYWIGEEVPPVIDVILCLGNSSISGRSARDEIVKWLDSVFIVNRNNKKELNSTLFEKLYIEYNKDLSSKENNKIRNDGIDLLIEAVSNDNIDKEAVFSVMASAVKYNGLSSNYEKDYDIKRFMEKYIDIDYRPYTATLNNIESLSKMWTDFFGGSNRYGPKSGFMMRSFSGYDDKDQYNVVTKMTEHIYKNIINNIKNKSYE